MKNNFLTITLLLLSTFLFGQQPVNRDTLNLLFVGDIMGHKPQIESAYNTTTKTYNYDPVFEKVTPIIQKADFTIGNLEVTLAGPPYKGYPQFSSPDALALACKKAGFDVLTTSNNHTCDRGKKGILRTLNVLDTLQISHTGSFRNKEEHQKNNLLILEKNNIKVGLLNYTYGTNGLPIPKPTVVNLIDTETILRDVKAAQKENLDKLIVSLHWGLEYKHLPSKKQKQLAHILFINGVDIIIGAHPHVLQPMSYSPKDIFQKERFIVYSLGNYVSNQRTRGRDGGAMVSLTLVKDSNGTRIENHGYFLTWVHKYNHNNKNHYQIIPTALLETNSFEGLSSEDIRKAKLFINDTRKLFKKENTGIEELKNIK